MDAGTTSGRACAVRREGATGAAVNDGFNGRAPAAPAARPRARGRWRDRAGLAVLLRAAGSLACGTLDVITPERARHRFRGAGPGPHGVLEVRAAAGLSRLLTRGDLGFAQAWMDGSVDTPDLDALLELGALNEAHLARALREKRWFRALQRIGHALRGNTRSGSRRNIAYHYDLGNAFYRLWLDDTMTYSAALFDAPAQPLAQAQSAKYRRLIEQLAPAPGDHLLEIGCGWGGFAVEAARTHGCRVTGITLSREQYDFARRRVHEAGLADRVDIRLQDYRDLRGTFDHVVSIEMFEAVGEAWWPAWFAAVRDRLRPGGRAAVQVITIDDAAFPRYRRGCDFIQRYVFPGGMLPTPRLFEAGAAAAGLHTRARDFFGAHYARTLECWHRQVLDADAEIRALGYDERFMRMWRYYLSYCRAGFVTGRVDLMQTVLTRAA